MSPLAVAIIAADAVVDQAPQATNHDPDQIVPLVVSRALHGQRSNGKVEAVRRLQKLAHTLSLTQ